MTKSIFGISSDRPAGPGRRRRPLVLVPFWTPPERQGRWTTVTFSGRWHQHSTISKNMRHTIYGHKRALFRLDNQTLLQSFHNNFFLFNPTEINVWLVLTYGPENSQKVLRHFCIISYSFDQGFYFIFFKMFQNFLTISTPTRGRPSTTSATCSSQKCWCIMPGHARLTEPSLSTKVLINYSHTCCENEQNKSPQRAVKKQNKKNNNVRWTTHTHTEYKPSLTLQAEQREGKIN